MYAGGCCLVLVAVFASAFAVNSERMPDESVPVVELRSYGERNIELLDLMLPFFARMEFSEIKRFPPEFDKGDGVILQAPNGDQLATQGTFNCIVVGYIGDTGRQRKFMRQLGEFVVGLPAPYLIGKGAGWDSRTWCQKMPGN